MFSMSEYKLRYNVIWILLKICWWLIFKPELAVLVMREFGEMTNRVFGDLKYENR